MWNKKWEQIHQRQDWGKYPPEELVRFVARNYYKVKDRSKVSFLDLGCGLGAASWYLAREGFDVWGIDGSKTSIDKVIVRFRKENLQGFFENNDYLKTSYSNNIFDCVIDVCSIQHNSPKDQQLIINNIYKWLKPGGKVFSMMFESERKPAKDPAKDTCIYCNTYEGVKQLYKKFKNVKIGWLFREEDDNFEGLFIITAEKQKRKR